MKLCLFVPSKVFYDFRIRRGSTDFITAQKFSNVMDSLLTVISSILFLSLS